MLPMGLVVRITVLLLMHVKTLAVCVTENGSLISKGPAPPEA